jgi:ABC-type phosphate transport system substrate-binding protein
MQPGLGLLLLLLGLLLAASATPSLLLAAAAPSAPAIAGSVNIVFLDLFRQSLLAYQLQVPTFTGVTLSSNIGDTGLAMATSGNFDWTISTGSVPDRARTAHPTLEAYPVATIGVVPAYNLPVATVGDATLTLVNEVMCRIWRGNITHWSVAVRQRSARDRAACGGEGTGHEC